MRPHPRTVLLACATALIAGVVPNLAAAMPVRHVRLGSVARRPAGSRVDGALAATAQLNLTVALRPRDPDALAAYVTAVSTPGSEDYHRYLSVGAFRQRFGPSTDEIGTVEASLRAQGLDPGPLSADGLAIPITANVGAVGHAFSTSFDRLQLPSGRTAYANTQPPSLDASVVGDVQGVIGLDDLSPPAPLALPRARAPRTPGHARGARTRSSSPRVVTGGPQPCAAATRAAAGMSGAYTADQVADAYDFSGLYAGGDEGAGQTVAVYELESNLPSDVSAYQQCYGTDASVSYVEVDGGPAPLDLQAHDGIETALDVDGVIGLAPKANVLVYQGPNSQSGAYDTYNAIVSQDRANVMTTSWGECEPDLGSGVAQAESTLFQEAAVQGQTVLAAAGDTGSEDCDGTDMSNPDQFAVDDPGSQPDVTSVGGTSLTLSPRSETVWNDSAGAGGGGVSSLWPMPSYQSNAPDALNVVNSNSSGALCAAASGYCREVPDVSADADAEPGVLVYYDNQWTSFGGTSATAPLWASLIALADDEPGCSQSPVGFANPALYGAAAGAYSADFNDITSGENDFTGTAGGLYPAGPGYDMASGLGSPVAGALAPDLCGQTLTIADPGPQTTLAGSAVRLHVTATGSGGETLSYVARGLPRGLSINASTGVISGAPTSAGDYAVSVAATDSSGAIRGLTFPWTVLPAQVSVTDPGNRAELVGSSTRLQIRARSNNGAAIIYSAGGLPRGVAINRATGLISGKPKTAGTYATSVSAAAAGAPSKSVRLTWTVTGRAAGSHASLSGISTGKVRLAFKLAAGAHAGIHMLSIRLPRGLAFSGNARSLKKHTFVRGPMGRRLGVGIKPRNGVLSITIPSGSSSARLALRGAIHATAHFAAAVERKQTHRVAVVLKVLNTYDLTTTLTLRVRPS